MVIYFSTFPKKAQHLYFIAKQTWLVMWSKLNQSIQTFTFSRPTFLHRIFSVTIDKKRSRLSCFNCSSVSNQWTPPSTLCRDMEKLLRAQSGVEYFGLFLWFTVHFLRSQTILLAHTKAKTKNLFRFNQFFIYITLQTSVSVHMGGIHWRHTFPSSEPWIPVLDPNLTKPRF